MPKIAKAWVLHFGYHNADEDVYVICVDDARFFNHSENPNTDDTSEVETIATKDIHKREEITCNYFEFDADAKLKLAKKN